ncbi:MAG TPA: hypothetical protein VHR55_09035 [Candidatus Limnocylindria bacterium]|nr:hypothetical protein [Candidatus Limnocylindria bacterium]
MPKAKQPKARQPKAKQPKAGGAPTDPDKLVRQAAGTYRTADDRFEVRDSGNGWFLVDTAQTNDFGQELILGPFPTLASVGAAIPSARASKVTPTTRPSARTGGSKTTTEPKAKPKPKPKPKSWIDELPKREADAVRARIAALEKAGVERAGSVVRRDREGIAPEVATRFITARLEAIADELPERGREGARELLRRAAEVLTAEGGTRTKGLPGWILVELGPDDDEPPNRRIIIRELSD